MIFRRIAILLILGTLTLKPCAAWAQTPDLGEKVQGLIAHVRDRGAQLRPQYQDTLQPHPQPPPTRRDMKRSPSATKPAHAQPPCCTHGTPENNAR